MSSTKSKSPKLKPYGIALTVTVMMLSIAAYTILPAMATSRQTQEERTYEIIKPNWPVGVLELVEVKNLQSESFPEDFEVRVKNVGNKPIYGIYFGLGFPDIRIGGAMLGNSLFYGDQRLSNSSELAKSADIPIEVGETGALKLTAIQVKGFRLSIDKGIHTLADCHKMRIVPQIVNFGDGTGYLGNSPYPAKRENN